VYGSTDGGEISREGSIGLNEKNPVVVFRQMAPLYVLKLMKTELTLCSGQNIVRR